MTLLLAQEAMTGTLSPSSYVPPMDALGLPSPVWVFQFFTVLTMLLHLIFMNFSLGGVLVATVLDFLNVGNGGKHNDVVRVIWQVLPVTLSFAITTGVAPLLFVQVLYGHYFYPANVFLGFVWFAIVPIMIIGFYLTYVLAYRLGNAVYGRIGRWDTQPGKRLLISVPVAGLFLCMAWILTHNHMLSIQPDVWPQDGGWPQNRVWVTPETTLPRLMHNVGGATALCGLWLALMGWWRRARGVDTAEACVRFTKTGLWVAVPMVVAAAVLGPVFYFSLPGDIQSSLLTPNIYTVLWWVGIACILVQLMLMFAAHMKPDEPRWLVGLALAMVLTVVGMLCAREQVRFSYLAREGVGFEVSDWSVRSQVTPLLMFLVLLVVALGTVGWLLWMSAKAPRVPVGEGDRR